MASDVVIRAEGLGKKYIIGHEAQRERYVALRDVLARGARDTWRRTADMLRGRTIVSGDTTEEIWALKDVSFEVKRGEVLGIIGRNGAGKSTLLKILSRITEPSEGRVTIKGRVASLLEVGTGFHPELTGRENIYLNGAILGMSRAEIKRKFDEIVAFAEVERFLDTPVKRYSSGMYVRLAFAVAAHLEPEILIVDEVLAVGDADFQKKCQGKMRNVSTKSGRTVLFVSHNMTAVASLCSKVLLLGGGRIERLGAVHEVTELYLRPIGGGGETCKRSWTDIEIAPGDERVRVRKVEVLAEESTPCAPIELATPFRIEIEYWNLVDNAHLILEVIVRNSDGTVLFHSLSTEDPACENIYPRGLLRSVCYVPGNLINEGRYAIDVHFMHGTMSNYTSLLDAAVLIVQDTAPRGDLVYFGRYLGQVHPRLRWCTTSIGLETMKDAPSRGMRTAAID
jgi:lipopolysaccharide transport system ATP-binding protein